MGRLPHFPDDRAAPSYVLLICLPWPTPPSALASSVSHSYSPSFASSLPAFPSPLAIFTWILLLFTITLLSQALLPLSFALLPLSFISLLLSFTSLSLSLASQTLLLSSPPSTGLSSLSFTFQTPSHPTLPPQALSSFTLACPSNGGIDCLFP